MMRWITDLIEHNHKVQFGNGYQYAAGKLLQGSTPKKLRDKIEACWDFDEFDNGILKAIQDWEKLNVER